MCLKRRKQRLQVEKNDVTTGQMNKATHPKFPKPKRIRIEKNPDPFVCVPGVAPF